MSTADEFVPRPASRRLFILLGSLCVPFAIGWALFRTDTMRITAHQQAVTKELAAWEAEFSKIDSTDDAIRTADMLGYVQTYYPLSDGYRSTPEVEARMERQRKETLFALAHALREFTGNDFGHDSEQWIESLSPSERSE